MSSVLGKRTRGSNNAAPKITRAKRARVEVVNDENENPFNPSRNRDADENEDEDGDSMELDELSLPEPTSTIPAKHGRDGKRILRTPSKARQNFDIIIDKNGELINSGESGLRSSCTEDELPALPTPQTPRHRDALSKKVAVTPRHRVMLPGANLTPRTPTTPGGSVSTIYGKARALFTRSNEPGRLIGREAERQELTEFVQNCIASTSGGCTYVSGPPGTGKSAMVNEVVSGLEPSETLKSAYINCMSIKSSTDLYGNLIESFGGDLEVRKGEEVKALQNLLIPKKKSSVVYVVTLDEIDHILTLDLEILYKLFEWSLQKSSKLVLLGIANALDLTDRFLPRLKARNLKPNLLPFLPYTAAQMKNVIMTRLKSLVPADSATPDYVPFLHPAAIDLCSRKVSSQSGDLRKAFDICRRAIDLIESETKQKHHDALNENLLLSSPSKRPLEENINLSSPATAPSPTSSPSKRPSTSLSLSQSLATLTIETAPRATISHVNKITLSTFGHGATQRLKTLNLQQKAALCALLALEKRNRASLPSSSFTTTTTNIPSTPSKKSRGNNTVAPTIKSLYTVYTHLCTRDAMLHPLTSTEFRDVVGSLETLSLVGIVDGRNGSFVSPVGSGEKKRGRKSGGGFGGMGGADEKRVGSCVGEREVEKAVEGLGGGILRGILFGEGWD